MWQKIKNYYHLVQANAAVALNLYPGRGMTIIGVTGTDGKTTTCNLLYHILSNAGYKTAMVSTTGAIIDGKASDVGLHVTTPSSFTLQHYLNLARRAKVSYIVLEVTSHALDQYRAFGIPFAVGVVTNVSKEHLDYHKTYENYVSTKSKLLRQAKVAIVNKDDHSYWQIRKKELRGKKEIVTYGMKKDSDVNPHVFQFTTKMIGQFNKYNCLAAIAALQVLQIPEDKIKKGLASFMPPVGRQEILYRKDFIVINDFAHTPNSFLSVLPEMRKLASRRLIHVFGAAARRDTYKRAEMGSISSRFSDIMIVTSEDPRDEPIDKINGMILSGVTDKRFTTLEEKDIPADLSKLQKDKKYIFIVPDRKKAISLAIRLAQKGDVVVMTGKGHEKSMNYGRGEEPWNESETAKTALRDRKLL